MPEPTSEPEQRPPRIGTSAVQAPSIVYTFYSYKGGVGRSMAVANVAALLARRGHSVLIVDWDLEAPGLERYFTEALHLGRELRASKPGMVDLIVAHRDGRPIDWKECVHSLPLPSAPRPVALITAGRDTPDYVRHVQGLDWRSLFAEHRLGHYLEQMRQEWLREYEYVLVDSRTGISDIGGICTILLPDVLVLMFTSNRQSVEGIADVVRRARAGQEKMAIDRPRLFAVPVPARDERNSASHRGPEAQEWIDLYTQTFGPLFREWLPEHVTERDALSKLYIPYIANWSFGERLPVIEEQRADDPASISAAYGRLATLLEAHLDWKALDRGIEAHEVDQVRARSIELEQSIRRVSRSKRLYVVGAVALVLIVSLLAVFNENRNDRLAQVARAESILAAASAAASPLTAHLLVGELAGLPEPPDGSTRARRALLSNPPVCVVSQPTFAAPILRLRLSHDGRYVAAIYADGRASVWRTDGRGDAQSLPFDTDLYVDVDMVSFPEDVCALVERPDRALEALQRIPASAQPVAFASSRAPDRGDRVIGARPLVQIPGFNVFLGQGESSSMILSVVIADKAFHGPAPFALLRSTILSSDGARAVDRDADGWYADSLLLAEDGGVEVQRGKSFDLGYARCLAVAPSTAPYRLVVTRPDEASIELVGIEDRAVIARTTVDEPNEGIELTSDFVLALNSSEQAGSVPQVRRDEQQQGRPDDAPAQPPWESHVRTRIWPADGPWPARTSRAASLHQAWPWLAVHHVSADGKWLATASADGTIWVWPIGPAAALESMTWSELSKFALTSTTACLSVEDRMRLLAETFEDARGRYEDCERAHERTPRATAPPAAAK